MFELLLSFYLTSFNIPIVQDSLSLELKPVLDIQSEADFELNASSFLAVDLYSNNVLLEYQADQKLPMASLTKLMTALLIIENHYLDEVVTVSKEATMISGARLGLKLDEKITIDNLLKALLVRSANDAAIALAVHHSGNIELFVEKMNQRAQELNMTNTNFKNPHGFDDIDHYSTSKDLLILSKFVLNFDFILQTVNLKDVEIKSLTHYNRNVKNTNKILGEGISGLKTGTTPQAGECLILLAEKQGKKVLTIILNSQQRFEDSKKFLDFLWNNIKI